MKKELKDVMCKFYLVSFVFLVLIGCDSNGGYTQTNGIGPPRTLYEIKGRVVSGKSHKPIDNTKVVLIELIEDDENPYIADTIYTSESGEFELQTRTLLHSKFKLKLDHDDIEDELIIDFCSEEDVDNDLYNGRTEKNMGDILLENKIALK